MLREKRNALGAAPEPESKDPSGYLRAGKRKINAKNISAMLKMSLRVEFIYFPNVNIISAILFLAGVKEETRLLQSFLKFFAFFCSVLMPPRRDSSVHRLRGLISYQLLAGCKSMNRAPQDL